MRALLVIDMLNDFIREDGALFCGPSSRKIIPFIKDKIEKARSRGDFVVYICDAHREDDLEFASFPRHAVAGTEGAAIIDELAPAPSDVVLKKTRYSGFYGSGLADILAKKTPDAVEVVGVCTSICVMDTVGGLRNRDYEVAVYKDGVADFDQEAHQFALKRMERIYKAKII